MKIALLTSPKQWFVPYAKDLATQIKAKLFYDHFDLNEKFDLVFILSYHQIIAKNILSQNKLNLVIHASNLPQGKGWSPLFWQVAAGKNDIVFSLFEADSKIDNGDIYLQKTLHLNGLELYEELRVKQAKMCVKLCLEFLVLYPNIKARKQSGKESFYPKRSEKDSELDLHKSLAEQFNLLRICSNDEFPAFFMKNGKKFVLKIYSDGGGGLALFSFFFAFCRLLFFLLFSQSKAEKFKFKFQKSQPVPFCLHKNFYGLLRRFAPRNDRKIKQSLKISSLREFTEQIRGNLFFYYCKNLNLTQHIFCVLQIYANFFIYLLKNSHQKRSFNV